MNNTTESNRTFYYPFSFWLKILGSTRYSEIVNISLIPIGFIGFLLNILAIVVLKARPFELPVFDYLRYYAIKSATVCLLITTLFLSHTSFCNV
jgi:hypothetical protein